MSRYFATFVSDDYWYHNDKLIGTDAHWGSTLNVLKNQIKLTNDATISSKIVDGKKEYVVRKRFAGFRGSRYYGTLVLIKDRDDNGEEVIIYSNGFLTNGKKIATKEIEEWFEDFEKTINEPATICVKTYAKDGSVTECSVPVRTK